MFTPLALPTAETATWPVISRLLCGAAIVSSLALGACGTIKNPLDFASLTEKPAPQSDVATGSTSQTELQKATEYWGKQYESNPGDAKAAINYVHNLKALNAKPQALQVIQQAYTANPNNKAIASEYGRLALEQDQISLAEKLLEKADDPTAPDWKTISARGTVLAKQNKYREAIVQFERARALAPDKPSVLNNLALAYAMDGHAEKAEPLLRQAASDQNADAKVSQNLSLVLGLQGKSEDAKAVMVKNAPDDEARDDANYVKEMVGTQPMSAPATVIRTSSTLPAPMAAKKTMGKSKPAGDALVEDPAVLVKRLADGYSATPADAPIQLVPKQ